MVVVRVRRLWVQETDQSFSWLVMAKVTLCSSDVFSRVQAVILEIMSPYLRGQARFGYGPSLTGASSSAARSASSTAA